MGNPAHVHANRYHRREARQPGDPLSLLVAVRSGAAHRPREITTTAFWHCLDHDYPGLLSRMRQRLTRRRASGRAAANAEYVWLVGTGGVTVIADSHRPPVAAPIRSVLDPHMPYGYARLYVYELDVPDGGLHDAMQRQREADPLFQSAIHRERQLDEREHLRQPERR